MGSDATRADINDGFALFQSTLPVWGATCDELEEIAKKGISIHAPRMGSDRSKRQNDAPSGNFNPRSPYGERHVYRENGVLRVENFNPRSPYGERLGRCFTIFFFNMDFNPRSPYGERPQLLHAAGELK